MGRRILNIEIGRTENQTAGEGKVDEGEGMGAELKGTKRWCYTREMLVHAGAARRKRAIEGMRALKAQSHGLPTEKATLQAKQTRINISVQCAYFQKSKRIQRKRKTEQVAGVHTAAD